MQARCYTSMCAYSIMMFIHSIVGALYHGGNVGAQFRPRQLSAHTLAMEYCNSYNCYGSQLTPQSSSGLPYACSGSTTIRVPGPVSGHQCDIGAADRSDPQAGSEPKPRSYSDHFTQVGTVRTVRC